MCDFVELDCPKECGRKLKRKDLRKHLEAECPNRTVPCRYCQEEVTLNGLGVCRFFFSKSTISIHQA